MSKPFLILSLFLSAAALAQTTPAPEFSPPPMVPVAPPPTPAPEPGTQLVDPGTPPPPSALPPPTYVPGQPGTNYPYSPYGTPRTQQATEKPPLEWGYMVSESLFGMLTAAGVSLLPYFLLLRPMVQGQSVLGDSAIDTTIFVLIFSAVPLAVMQTQVSLANGSRYYMSESWPAALAGLGAEAAVLSIFLALPPQSGFLATSPMAGKEGGPAAFLLVGSIVFVPLVQMAVINLTKSLRSGARMGAIEPAEKKKDSAITLRMPTVAPLVAQTRLGMSVGMQASLINFSW